MAKVSLKNHRISAFFGYALALMLGLISAVLAALVGPSLQLLLTGGDLAQRVDFNELFGERLAPWVSYLARGEINTVADFFAMLPVLLLTVALLKALFSIAQWFLWERVGEKISRALRSDIMGSYLRLSPLSLVENPDLDADVSALVSTDVRYLREYVVRFYGGLPREGAQAIFLTFTLYLLSPQLLMWFVFGIGPIAFLLARVGKSLRRRAKRVMSNYAELNDWLQQRFLGLETIKHYQTEDYELALMKEKNQSLFRSLYRAETLKAMTGPFVEWIAFVIIAVILYISLLQLIENEVSNAVQLSFFSTLALLSQAIGKLSRYYNINREASAAAQRIDERLAQFKAEPSDGSAVMRVNLSKGESPHVDCQGLTYRFWGRDIPAVDDFTYRFKGGAFYCVAGASGAGKSTLLRMLLGILPPTKGSIQIAAPDDASDFRARQSIGYLPQRAPLTAGSLAENVAYPDSGIDTQRVRQALEAVDLAELVAGMEQGLDTQVGMTNEGRELSGGQEQRVQLARLLYHRYPIILIDEGTSALDPVSEVIVYKTLRNLAADGALVIMIAHRVAAFEYCDQVLFMHEGKLFAAGTYEEMQQNKLFCSKTQYGDN